MKRSPILNPLTDATYEQITDPASQGYIVNGATWYNPRTDNMWYRSGGEWELIHDDHDDEIDVGDLWYNEADKITYIWTGEKWDPRRF